jgi:hypothetical protein
MVNTNSPAEHSGSANSINTMARSLGGALGTQAGTAIIAGYTTAAAAPRLPAFPAAFLLAATAAAAGAAITTLRSRPEQTRTTER